MEKKKKKTKAIQVIRRYDLDKPTQLIIMAQTLKQHIIKNSLYVEILGKNYVMVEGWQFAGFLLGLFPKIIKVECLDKDKWFVQADIINTKDGSVVSSGFALCSKTEAKKSGFDEYAILSMAQTRAIGRAYRNFIGWIIKLAGYEGAPAEEMQKVNKAANPEKPEPSADPGNKKIEELKGKLKGETDKEKIADLKKRTGVNLSHFNITEKHAGILLACILNVEVKK